MKVYKFYADPGHGWLAVKRAELDKLGIADRVTGYSYKRGATVYLEEDCDYSVFADAMKAAGKEFKIESKHCNGRSPIRSYDRYHA